jgi:quercetin 2,3-dioxygenase
MSDDFTVKPLGFPWETADPFLFCVHHDDDYPAGDERMAPVADLAGRDLGQDFSRKDGWSMYHGDVVPGFPGHPHRGFETVTIVRQGLIDHFDSLGATARFGGGDVQWLTAGKGISHSEMFPLVDRDQRNPAELFQIWLNLPRDRKMATPHFAMLWNERIPRRELVDAAGKKSVITLIAGDPGSPPPPPESWAARPDSHVAIWTIAIEPGATLTLPADDPSARRTLYFFAGSTLKANGRPVNVKSMLAWKQSPAIELVNDGDAPAELLMLQGRPIAEPTVQYGPFVMNSADEIRQAFADYQRTQFGGWPWPSPDPVHARDRGRFAQHADGRVEEAPVKA